MTTKFAPLSEAASAVLAEQIETMRGDLVALIACGVKAELAQTLVSAIAAMNADMSDLKAHGLDIKAAVAICEALAARRARADAAVARIIAPGQQPPPLPLPNPQAPAGISFPPRPLGRPLTTEPAAPATDEPIGRIAALSLLHDLCLAIDAGRCEVSTLSRAGFSEIASAELAHLINSTGGTGD